MDIDRVAGRWPRSVEALAERVDDRHAHAHRLADHDRRALRRARWPRASRSSPQLRAMGAPDRLAQHGRRLRHRLPRTREAPADRRSSPRRSCPACKATGCRLALEPGRVIVGNAGILVSRVIYHQAVGRQAVPDPGRRDERPDPAGALRAFHRIWPVAVPASLPPPPATSRPRSRGRAVDVVGPICESGDFLAKDRALPRSDARRPAGHLHAPAPTAWSWPRNYNTRPRAAEVLVDGEPRASSAARETLDDLLGPEMV